MAPGDEDPGDAREPWELVEFPEVFHPLRFLFGPLVRERPRTCPKCGACAAADPQRCAKCLADLPPPKLYFDSRTSYGLVFLGCVVLGTLYVAYFGLRIFRDSATDLAADSAATKPATVTPSADAGTAVESLPKFGEYVYIEELPETVTKVPPVYPDAAIEASVEGTVIVWALVGRDGRVKDTRIIKSVPMLDGAARRAVGQWVFKPAKVRQQPVAAWVSVPVRFTLEPSARSP